MLTALAAVVVLLTRSRLVATEHQSGVFSVSHAILNAHSVVGVLAIAAWAWWLSGAGHGVGAVAVALWWALTLLGLAVLSRWLPSHGRHSGEPTDDGWAEGPWLSILGHVGMLLGVCYFTWFFLADKL
jgi:hypothetical protein